MKYIFLLFILIITFGFGGCREKHKVITGYETKIVFILDKGYQDINTDTRQGWEIKSARRATESSSSNYGYEYVLQKAIYTEE